MTKEVKCPPCGETISGATDDELVANVVGHAKIHGHVVGDADRDEILASAREI
jgi:ribosomal protein S27E